MRLLVVRVIAGDVLDRMVPWCAEQVPRVLVILSFARHLTFGELENRSGHGKNYRMLTCFKIALSHLVHRVGAILNHWRWDERRRGDERSHRWWDKRNHLWWDERGHRLGSELRGHKLSFWLNVVRLNCVRRILRISCFKFRITAFIELTILLRVQVAILRCTLGRLGKLLFFLFKPFWPSLPS